jgi:hypothetical protein
MKRLPGFRFDAKAQLADSEGIFRPRRRPALIVELLELDNERYGDGLNPRRAVD